MQSTVNLLNSSTVTVIGTPEITGAVISDDKIRKKLFTQQGNPETSTVPHLEINPLNPKSDLSDSAVNKGR